ncbi:hypothetical protein EI94DRAFT_1834740 [Lactarius quietus]|nr:hypothetical protein EI94DRAFT_1834740 [Lactarius quietus]
MPVSLLCHHPNLNSALSSCPRYSLYCMITYLPRYLRRLPRNRLGEQPTNIMLLKWPFFAADTVALSVITTPTASYPRGDLVRRKFFNGPSLLVRPAALRPAAPNAGSPSPAPNSLSSFVSINASCCAAGEPVTCTAHRELLARLRLTMARTCHSFYGVLCRRITG